MDYPKKYKIIGYQFSVDDSRKVETRKTKDILQVFGAFGGVLKFLGAIVGGIVGFFTVPAFPELLANRLYQWQTPDSCEGLGKPDGFQYSRKMFKKPDVEIPLVDHYIFHRILLRLTGCCRKRYWASDYELMLNKVKADASFQLDIVRNLRRIRAHGFGISMLLDKGILAIASSQAKEKPVALVDEGRRNMNNNLWESLE